MELRNVTSKTLEPLLEAVCGQMNEDAKAGQTFTPEFEAIVEEAEGKSPIAWDIESVNGREITIVN